MTPILQWPKPKPIQPMSRAMFRKRMGIQFGFTLGLLLSTLFVYQYAFRNALVDLRVFTVLGFALVGLVTQIIWNSSRIMHARILDIDPQLSSKQIIWLLMTSISPVLWYVWVWILSTRPSYTNRDSVPRFFRYSKVALLFSCVIFIGPFFVPTNLLITSDHQRFSLPQIGRYTYWLANPTTHYMVHLGDEVQQVMNARRDRVPAHDFASKRAYSATGWILIHAHHSLMMKQGTKKPSNEEVLKELVDLINIQSEQRPGIAINPLAALSPIGLVEVALLMSINELIELKTNAMMIASLKNVWEKNPDKLPDLRKKLESIRIYRTAANMPGSLFSKLSKSHVSQPNRKTASDIPQ